MAAAKLDKSDCSPFSLDFVLHHSNRKKQRWLQSNTSICLPPQHLRQILRSSQPLLIRHPASCSMPPSLDLVLHHSNRKKQRWLQRESPGFFISTSQTNSKVIQAPPHQTPCRLLHAWGATTFSSSSGRRRWMKLNYSHPGVMKQSQG